MSETAVDSLVLDLVEWVGRTERTYADTMDAWRTSCPRLTVWEDACERGYVERALARDVVVVRVTSAGLNALKERRPSAYDDLRRADRRQ